MTLSPALIVIVGLVVVVGSLSLSEAAAPGPSRALTATRRYGLWPYVTGAALAAATATAVLVPASRLNLASLAVLAVPALVWGNARRRLFARAVLRARWPSVARSCGLGVRRDVRGRQWPFDSTVTIGNDHVEYLPVISRPRQVLGVGVRYRLTPARGGTVDDVGAAAEALAAGLRVARVEVTRIKPSRGELLAVWP